jgi:hypothetical protein
MSPLVWIITAVVSCLSGIRQVDSSARNLGQSVELGAWAISVALIVGLIGATLINKGM